MPILCYHSVRGDWDSPLAMDPARFEGQLEWLSNSHRVVDLHTATGMLDGKWLLPSRTSALTFDDGFVDFFDIAWPLLRRYRLPATVFVVAETLRHGWRVDWVDDPPAEPLQTLSVDQVRELAESGVEIASHSLTHRRLPELSEEECRRDLAESKQILEDVIGKEVLHLAYPRGLHDEKVQEAARAAGYRYSFALPESREIPNDHAVPRVGLYRNDNERRFWAKTQRWYPRLRTGPVYTKLRQIAGRNLKKSNAPI